MKKVKILLKKFKSKVWKLFKKLKYLKETILFQSSILLDSSTKLGSFISLFEFINILKSENSYDQYHWWPIIFKVIEGSIVSDIAYNKLKEGNAINAKINAGIKVQIISKIVPWVIGL